MSEVLLFEQHGSAAILTLNRTEKRNALSADLLRSIDEAVDFVDTEPSVRGAILTGGQKMFSSGADLKEALAANSMVETARFLENFRRTNDRLESLSKPVVAAINGYCLTGGLELALCCDFRISGAGAKFGVTSARIGSLAGAGAPQRMARLIGAPWTKDLLFSGRIIEADMALRIGLVNEVVESDQVLQTALQRIEEYSLCAPMSVSFAKLAVNRGLQMDIDSALAFDRSLTASLFTTEDRQEGMNAFFEKRSPQFKGS